MRRYKGKWRWLARLGGALLLSFFLLLISLPNLLDLDNYRPKLLNYLRSQLAGEVSIGKLGLTYQHGPGLRIDGVRIFDKSGAQHLTVTTIIINFDLRDLLGKRLHLARLTLIRPEVVLQLDRNRSTLTNFLSNSVKNNIDAPHDVAPAGWRVDSEVSGALVEVVDGAVEFTDDCFASSPITTRVNHLELLFSWPTTDLRTKFKLTSTVLDKGGDGSLQIEGNLSNIRLPIKPGKMMLDCKIRAANLNVGTYFPYYQKYVPLQFVGGRLDIDSNYDGSLMGLFHSRGRMVLHRAELDYQHIFLHKLEFETFAVDYDFRLADSYNTIETRKFTIDADGLKLFGHCLLYDARSGIDGTIDARFNSSIFDPMKILPLLPWKILPEQVRTYGDRLKEQGSLMIEGAYLQGDYRKIMKLLDEKPPAGIIGGQLYGKNLAFAAAGSIPSFRVDKAEVVFADNRLEIKDFNGSAADAVTCSPGNLTLNNIYQQVQSKFSGQLKLDLQKLNHFLPKVAPETTALDAGKMPAPLIKFEQGTVAGKLAFSGPLKQPEKIHWHGDFKGNNISLVFAGLTRKIEHGTARLKLEDDSLQIVSATFDFATLPVNLQGTLSGPSFFFQSDASKSFDVNLRAECVGFTPAQLNLLSGEVYNISGLKTGPSSLAINVRSDSKAQSGFKLAGRLNLEWGDVSLPFIDKTFDTLTCQAEFDQKSILFKQFNFKRGQSDLSFQGSLFKESDNYKLTGKFNSSYLDLDEFPLSDKQITDDKLNLSFVVDGVVEEMILPADPAVKKTGRASLWRQLNDFNFSLSGGLDSPINIDECRWQWGGEHGRVNISGTLQALDKMQGDIEIEADNLDLDTLLGAADEPEPEPEPDLNKSVSPDELQNELVKVVLLNELNKSLGEDRVKSVMSWKQKLLRDELNLNIQARVQRLHWRQMVLDKIESDVHVSAAGVNVERLTGRIFKGEFNIYAGWRFADDSFMLESQLDDVSLETLSNYLENPDRGLPMSGGEGSVTLDLYWHGDSAKSWEESLDGALDFNFHDGRLKRFTLIANISSLLNLSQFASLHMPELSVDQGVPYKELICKGLIVGGQLEIDEFDMQGPAFNIFGSGDIDFINDRLDLKFGIQPLQTIDKILASIPVVGYILTGDNKTFVVIPVTVTGPFDKARIKTQTVAGMGRNTIGMVQRFFKTPIRLLQIPGKLIDKMGAGREPAAVKKNVVSD